VEALVIPPNIPERPTAGRRFGATFGTESILLPPAVDFPRELMEPALAEHARILRARAREIVHAVTEDDAVEDGCPFDEVASMAAVILADGERHDVRAWRILGRRVKGYDPVLVVLERGAGLRWLPREGGTDVAPPAPVNEVATDSGN
jgi:hypothetical protein